MAPIKSVMVAAVLGFSSLAFAFPPAAPTIQTIDTTDTVTIQTIDTITVS